MTLVTRSASTTLASILLGDAPAKERADKLALYGWLIGSWDATVLAHASNGVHHEGQGEIHFSWALEGRAIQDVWMIPRLKDRASDTPDMPIVGNWYGTTLRVYDQNIDAWRIFWIDPATNSFRQQIGRRRGPDIVQEGTTDAGALSRWSFTEISPRAFRWLSETSYDDGKSWRLVVEVLARRRASQALPGDTPRS
jgi:hypothetical protein